MTASTVADWSMLRPTRLGGRVVGRRRRDDVHRHVARLVRLPADLRGELVARVATDTVAPERDVAGHVAVVAADVERPMPPRSSTTTATACRSTGRVSTGDGGSSTRRGILHDGTTTGADCVTVHKMSLGPASEDAGQAPNKGTGHVAGMCEDRICIVTGAGRGIGREHALMLAAHGAKVVVNDLGGEMDGSGRSTGPAQDVVDEIVAAGGEAVANTDDISDWEGAQRLINTAVETFGGLDVLVNNAGILRDRMLVNMTEEEWDAVIKVHLKGTFAPTRWAASYWRDRMKAGETNDARIINTTSVSGIYGNPGQTNYGAAKMGIGAFTIISSLELGRYGVTVNAIAPGALTRMTENLGMGQASEEDKEMMSPRWIAPVATWLASTQSAGVTGPRVRGVGPRVRASPRAGTAARRRTRSTIRRRSTRSRVGCSPRRVPNADMAGQDRKD